MARQSVCADQLIHDNIQKPLRSDHNSLVASCLLMTPLLAPLIQNSDDLAWHAPCAIDTVRWWLSFKANGLAVSASSLSSLVQNRDTQSYK
jgi:hypothetical protein